MISCVRSALFKSDDRNSSSIPTKIPSIRRRIIMETIGLAASILALLIAAEKSCVFIHDVYVDLRDAPKDIRTQATKLDCLALMMRQLGETYKKLPKEFEIDIWLLHEIEEFDREIGATKAKVKSRLDRIEQGKKQKLKESYKWLLFDKEMKKFFESVDRWSMIISQAATVVQLYV